MTFVEFAWYCLIRRLRSDLLGFRGTVRFRFVQVLKYVSL